MKNIKRFYILALTMLLIIVGLPYQTQAASKPRFKATRSVIYENADTSHGVYTYTLVNVSKGQTVKWSISGSGRRYVHLDYGSKKITGSKVSNKITLVTNENLAAKNKKITITAKVYKKNGKLLKTVKTSSKIKILSKTITIAGGYPSNQYYTGQSYNFKANLFPLNSTDTVRWTAYNISTADTKNCITNTGLFTPTEAGLYTITASSYNNNSRRHTTSQTIQVYAGDSSSGYIPTTPITTPSAPVSIELLTTQVTCNQPTTIQYSLRDRNNNDVTAYYPGKIHFSSSLVQGVSITSNGVLTMTTSGAVTQLTLTYVPDNTSLPTLTKTGTIVCTSSWEYQNVQLVNVALDNSLLVMSNKDTNKTYRTINLIATNQYGNTYSLTNEQVKIIGPSYNGAPVVSYNATSNQIQVSTLGVKAGDYSYTATITSGTYSVTTTFFIQVIQ